MALIQIKLQSAIYAHRFNDPYNEGAGTGFHSEPLLVDDIRQFRLEGMTRIPGMSLVIEQIYTERIPCKRCAEFLRNQAPSAAIFYSVGNVSDYEGMGGRDQHFRPDLVMRAYGL